MQRKIEKKREYRKGLESKSDLVRLRITKEEKNVLERLASDKKMTLSDLIRSKFFTVKRAA